MKDRLDSASLDLLFNNARSFSYWQDKEVSDAQCKEIYNLMKMGPTAANSCPARIVFIKSDEAKARLKPHLDEGNVHKCMTAPVVAIIAMDLNFHDKLPELFPHTDARSWYAGKPEKIKAVAEKNSTLQGAYFIMAVRSLGLDAGPMSGFNSETLDKEFFQDGQYRSNFICTLGYGDESKLYPRHPRLDFDQACEIV